MAIWFAAERLLVVADLHWGYAASHRSRGNLVPWWGDDEIEQRLLALIRDYQPGEMIWLGDVVHAAEGAARAEGFLRQSPVPVFLLAGNHDRRWQAAGVRSVVRSNWFFHHGDASPALPVRGVEVIGHHHPAASWYDGAGTYVKLPALVVAPRRIILPAFSPWSAGTPWRAAGDEKIWAIAPTRIFPLSQPHAASLGIA